jgi:hypothetical protein
VGKKEGRGEGEVWGISGEVRGICWLKKQEISLSARVTGECHGVLLAAVAACRRGKTAWLAGPSALDSFLLFVSSEYTLYYFLFFLVRFDFHTEIRMYFFFNKYH